MVADTEPLIISMISTAYEDLKAIHRELNKFCNPDPQGSEIREAQTFFSNLEGLRDKISNHKDFGQSMEEHCKSVERHLDSIKTIKLKNAYELVKVVQE